MNSQNKNKDKIALDANYTFRRQFITLDKPTSNLPLWQHAKFNGLDFHIYAHPDLELTQVLDNEKSIDIVLLGYAIDPEFPERTNIEITQDILKQTSDQLSFASSIVGLAGRYVFIVNIKQKIFVFNDAGGLRSVYYTYKNDNIYIGTQSSILVKFLNLEPSENYETFFNSLHYKIDIEYWIPAGATLYQDLKHLIPNHFLDVTEKQQIRFWPTKNIKHQDLKPASEKASLILKNLMYAASLRKKLSIAITAGFDSRIIMAASKNIASNIFFYTVKNNNLKSDSYDIAIPRSILKKFKFTHNIIESIDPVDPDFHSICNKNVHLSHISWTKNLNGILYNYPQERLSIQGNGAEIARCALYVDGKHKDVISINQILEHYWTEWKEIPFILKSFDEWFKCAKKTCSETNMDIQDLFIMEQRTASWNAQANNESDIAIESFTPFLHRPLIELMLGVPSVYRQYESSVMHRNMIKYLWPELLNWPINKRWKKRDHFKHFMAYQLREIGLYSFIRKVYKMVHAVYMNLKQLIGNKKKSIKHHG